jgi:hypothetical protein
VPTLRITKYWQQFMTGDYLLAIHGPENEQDWFVLETDKGNYEFRLGGLRRTEIPTTDKTIELPFRNVRIIRAMTNQFAVYVELENGFCIVHSDTFIDANGNTSFEIYIHDNESFIQDGGLEGMDLITEYDY